MQDKAYKWQKKLQKQENKIKQALSKTLDPTERAWLLYELSWVKDQLSELKRG